MNRNKMMQEMREKGATHAEIAKVFNVTRQRVYQILSEEYNAKRRLKYKSVRLSTPRSISLDK